MSLDDIPPGVIRLRVRGTFKLNKEPQYQLEGWDCFNLNASTIDWADSCNAARAQIFPDIPLPAVDLFYEGMIKRLAAARQAELQQ